MKNKIQDVWVVYFIIVYDNRTYELWEAMQIGFEGLQIFIFLFLSSFILVAIVFLRFLYCPTVYSWYISFYSYKDCQNCHFPRCNLIMQVLPAKLIGLLSTVPRSNDLSENVLCFCTLSIKVGESLTTP